MLKKTRPSPAPSAAPDSVRAFNVIPNSFSLQWEMIPCIHRNGDITGYSVQYGEVGSESTQTVSISSSGTMNTIVTGLTSDTSYEVKVAGVNSIGIGKNASLTVDTPQSQYTLYMYIL